MAKPNEKALAKRFYITALKGLRREQMGLADYLVRVGRDLKKYPGASSEKVDDIRYSLGRMKSSIERARKSYNRARQKAMRLGVKHPGDKHGGKL